MEERFVVYKHIRIRRELHKALKVKSAEYNLSIQAYVEMLIEKELKEKKSK